jgi:hypothetical protein
MPLELSTGAGILLNVSPYAASSSVAWELALHGDVASAWRWGAGARLGLEPSRGEAFARFLVAPRFQTWAPSAGLELGATARDVFRDDDRLLEEARTASLEGVSPWYVGVVSSPLSFRVWDRFRLSALDLEFGTHVAPLGRLVRLQIGFVSLGMDL